MAGTLFHARTFGKDEYTGNDGEIHYEVIPVEGGRDIVSISSWRELVGYCEQLGINEECWPAFPDAFDVPLDIVESKCIELRGKLCRLTDAKGAALPWLKSIVSYLENGEQVFYAEE